MKGVVLGLRAWLVAGVLIATASTSSQPPNVVIMLMDDMGWGDLGCNGEPNRETPNLDQMAREGLIASSMYTAAPLCSPSYTPQNMVGGIPDDEVLLPELLAQKGYTSGLVGKWHLGHQPQYLPLKHGFDFWFGAPNCHFGPYADLLTPNIPVFLNDSMVGRYYEDFHIDKNNGVSNMTQLFTDAAVEFINREANRGPFFLLWAPDATHAPTYASEKYRGTSRRGRYGEAVRELDAGVGAILDALRAHQVDNNTLVVFTSDNGAALVSKYNGGSNGPFLCGKQTTFEGGMRAPGIFWWPGVIPAGTTTHQVSSENTQPSQPYEEAVAEWCGRRWICSRTAAQLAGVQTPQDRIYDGLALAKSLTHPQLEVQRPVFLYRGNRLMAVRRGPLKIHLWTFSTPTAELQKGINFCPGAEVPNVTTPTPTNHTARPILFNVEVDPGERYPVSHLSRTYKDAIQMLKKVVKEHEEKLVPGEPQLNWCDQAVMHWRPHGCEALKECLPIPQSNPYLCDWPH
ncbi:N-acetylgalactosamine-6-sulfatase [Chionoecetes opilio]|uniref:N-acetylgalactosamine-6-sulfatase n=1 Tax=Chionoecetes opilio TaxID=41210 RepID=A0A8J8WN05_CHIOP|nr:N-acetylgalactosamine-6-sulfatase [Chionoecetes opilio]